MNRIAAALLMAGVLGLTPGIAFTEEDRLERAVRDARELQARQNQNSDPEVWLRSPDGQKWLKTFEGRDGKDTSTEPMHTVGPTFDGGASCRASASAWLSAQRPGARGTIADMRNGIGDCADYVVKDAMEKLRRR